MRRETSSPCADRTARARRRPVRGTPLQRRRLAGERLVLQARYPVDRVLEGAWNAEIVFGRAKDHAVGGADRIGKRVDRRGKPGRVLDVRVIERKFGKGWRRLNADALGCERRQQPLHHGVEGAFAQRAADRDDIQVGHYGLPMMDVKCCWLLADLSRLMLRSARVRVWKHEAALILRDGRFAASSR